MKKSNKNNTQLSQRDLELIDFLWKWKVCTTLGLSTKFFSGSSVWAYNRLLQLSKVGLVRCVAIDSTCKRFVWTLDQKGFYQATKDRFQLKEVGFASEAPEHDLFVTAMHLGDWLNSTPVGVELFSEQELRRKFESHYPNWVPKMAGRRPDGYWFIPDNKSGAVFALEVELSVKDQKEYGPIGQSYRDSEKIGRIFWVIESVSRAELLHQKFLDVAPEKYKRHDFILTPDFNKLGWEAPIVLGADQGKTFLYALCKGQESLIEASL